MARIQLPQSVVISAKPIVVAGKTVVILAELVVVTGKFVLVFTNPIAFSTKAECVCEMPVEMAGEGKALTTCNGLTLRSSSLQSLPKPLR